MAEAPTLDPTSPRGLLYAALALALPDDWTVIPEQRFPEVIQVTTVVMKHSEIEPLPEAPVSWLRHTILLTVAAPYEDQGKAENELDDAVTDLLAVIDGLSDVWWTSAKKVLVAPNLPYLGWDITLNLNTKKKEA